MHKRHVYYTDMHFVEIETVVCDMLWKRNVIIHTDGRTDCRLDGKTDEQTDMLRPIPYVHNKYSYTRNIKLSGKEDVPPNMSDFFQLNKCKQIRD